MSYTQYRTDVRPKIFRSLALLCEDESLSDAQLKAYQTRLQEYRTYLEAVSRLANCGNVCITEEAVMMGENGLLTGESLNALQHAGAISVYNTLQQNNWEFPVPEDGEVALVKAHTTVPDEFLDLEKPIRSDWPSVHISECFVEGEKAKLHGSARPLRTFLPPSVLFRNAADIDDDDVPEPEIPVSSSTGIEPGLEIVSTNQGLAVRKVAEKDGESEIIPLDDYYYGRQDATSDYAEEKAEHRFKCAVCQRMFYSNFKLMHHIMGHVDETTQNILTFSTVNQCRICNSVFPNAFDLRIHMEKEHVGVSILETPISKSEDSSINLSAPQIMAQQVGAVESTGIDSNSAAFSCRICSKEATSDLALAHHLQSTHRQREMPYVCRLCLFRSSLYEDILDHFKKAHDNSNHLLCTYCLRIFTPSDARVPGLPLLSSPSVSIANQHGAVSTVGLGAGVGQTQVYLQHLRMHQVRHQLRRCPSCRLTFTNKSDYQVHRRLDHKACLGPSAELQEPRVDDYMTENLEANTQPTETLITSPQRLSTGRMGDTVITTGTGFVDDSEAVDVGHSQEAENEVILLNAPEPSRTKNLSDLIMPPEASSMLCLECGDFLTTDDHKRYLPCSVCVFATCCATGFARHIHRAHIYNPDIVVDSHSGGPMIRPIVFSWLFESTTTSSHLEQSDGTTETTITAFAADQAQLQSRSIEAEVTTGEERVVAGDNLVASMDTSAADLGDKPSVDVQREMPICAATFFEPSPAVIEQNIESSTTKVENNNLTNEDVFACPRCALTGVDGNTLARHLVQDCNAGGATLQPDPEIVAARLQAEEQMRLHQVHPASGLIYATDANGEVSLVDTGGTAHAVTGEGGGQLYLATAADGTQTVVGDPMQFQQQQQVGVADESIVMPIVVSGEDGQLPEGGATIDFTNAGGDVIQRVVLPDDLHLEPGQTLVLIQGEDGQPQFAIVNQAEWEANNQQLIMQQEEDPNAMLLYGNIEGQRTGAEDEKENHFA